MSKIVRTKTPGDAWATTVEPEGGADGATLVDSGAITVADLVVAGPISVFSPEVGANLSVVVDYRTAVVLPSGYSWVFGQAPAFDVHPNSTNPTLAPLDAWRLNTPPTALLAYINGLAAPLQLGYADKDWGTILPLPATVTWTALTPYAIGDCRVGTDGHLLYCSNDGVSDAVEPTWAGQEGATAADGSAAWDVFNIPPAGTIRLTMIVL